ncbi:MAG: hypothetical protein JST04_00780 [Bdellovibrionales bacterium]|nr:hypothetical protein [Bdellovibrionales bacterium]
MRNNQSEKPTVTNQVEKLKDNLRSLSVETSKIEAVTFKMMGGKPKGELTTEINEHTTLSTLESMNKLVEEMIERSKTTNKYLKSF